MKKSSSKRSLPNVTLCALTSVDIPATVKALEYSCRGIDFGDVVLVTDRRPSHLPENIRYSHTTKLENINDFNYKMVYELGGHIHTDFAMIVHADGFIVHPECWRDEFLDYDYIGSPWPLPPEGDTTTYRDIHGNICRVGNSVGIRSKRLLDYPKKAGIPWTGQAAYGKVWYFEDGFICCRIRHLLEAEGMHIAPLEVARYFGHETMIPEIEGITPFCFHKWAGTNAQYPNFLEESKASALLHRAEKGIRRRLPFSSKNKG